MAAEIEVYSGGVKVKAKNGLYEPIPTPEGYTDSFFREAVAAYDTAFRMKGKLPEPEDILKIWPKGDAKSLVTIVKEKAFQKALRYRGIEVDENVGLTAEQRMVLLKLSDPFDRKGLAAKLKDLGVPMPTFQNWLKNPIFKEMYNSESARMYEDALPAIRSRVVSEAESGKEWAAKLVMDKTGEYSPRAQELENAQQVVLAMVEAIIKHVDSPEVRAKIAADVGLSAATMSALEGPTRI